MTATLSTEAALSAALDADPGNHLLRYALADCLDESAGTVACGRCDGLGLYARQRGLLNFDPMECPNCSGTGRVSDGRRERAEGYRVLAQLGLYPVPTGAGHGWHRPGYFSPEFGEESAGTKGYMHACLPLPWLEAVPRMTPRVADEDDYEWRVRDTRRDIDDVVAAAWPPLPADVRAKILGAA